MLKWIVIKKKNKFSKTIEACNKKLAKYETSQEFKSWLKKAIKEDSEILDELAKAWFLLDGEYLPKFFASNLCYVWGQLLLVSSHNYINVSDFQLVLMLQNHFFEVIFQSVSA